MGGTHMTRLRKFVTALDLTHNKTTIVARQFFSQVASETRFVR